MIFTRVADEDRFKWHSADLRAQENVDWWKSVVGIDESRINDKQLFRVLEWGGMEI